jgi:hypothetical protein
MSVELTSKLVGFLSGELSRKDRQAEEVRVVHRPGPGSKDEEIKSWTRESEPEHFTTLAFIEKMVQTVISRTQDHCDSFPAGRRRYSVLVVQHLGGVASYPFSLLPSHAMTMDEVEDADIVIPGMTGRSSRAAEQALNQALGTAMRSNTMMFDGSLRALIGTNTKMLEEYHKSQEEVRALRRENDELRSIRDERQWAMQREAKKDERTGKAIDQIFQFGTLALTKALGGADGKQNAPDRVMMLLKELKDSIHERQVQALMQVFSPAQLQQFIEVMTIVEKTVEDREEAAKQAPRNGAGANGTHAAPSGG